MRECLRKISQRIASFRIDFFGEETDVVGKSKDRFVNFMRFVRSAPMAEKFCFPKTAQAERAFPSIFTLLVAMHYPQSRYESLTNARVTLLHPIRGGVFKAVVREKENAGIDNIVATRLRVGPKLFAPSMLFYFTPNRGALFSKFIN